MNATSTIRVKRHRERHKRRTLYAEVEVPHSLTAHLITAGYLSEPDSFLPKKIGEAFMRYVQDQRAKLKI